MHRLIIAGSPRPAGRSAQLADQIFNVCIEECPDDGVSILSVASLDVAGCTGCDGCRPERDGGCEPLEEGDPLTPCAAVRGSDAPLHRCVIADDMDEVRKHLDAADEVIVVSPVYFAGAPSQLKALLDRLQPYYWSNVRAQASRRPATLHVVGEGGDPHGFEPLVGTVRSALGACGFALETVLDWVGKIDAAGEIVAEADVYDVAAFDAGDGDEPACHEGEDGEGCWIGMDEGVEAGQDGDGGEGEGGQAGTAGRGGKGSHDGRGGKRADGSQGRGAKGGKDGQGHGAKGGKGASGSQGHGAKGGKRARLDLGAPQKGKRRG